jgi:hypothetical protein
MARTHGFEIMRMMVIRCRSYPARRGRGGDAKGHSLLALDDA